MRFNNNFSFSKMTAILLLLAAVSFGSCVSYKNSGQIIKGDKIVSAQNKKIGNEYSGTYRLSDKKICDLVITISIDGNDYIYAIKGNGFKSTGKLSFKNSDGEAYLDFNGTLRSGDKSVVTGLYQDKRILIQNYGNSMNQYVCFKSCDSKYLEFVKSE